MIHLSDLGDEVLGIDPFELRLKNANRIADTSPNGIAYTDPSTGASHVCRMNDGAPESCVHV